MSNQDVGVENAHGWLPRISLTPQGFTPVFNSHSCENQRYNNEVVYAPTNHVQDRYFNTYGAVTPAKLEESVIRLPDDEFALVQSNSVVDQIVSANWEQLGVATTGSEKVGNYLKLSNKVVDHVLGELKNTVLDKLCFSRLDDMQAHIVADPQSLDLLDDDVAYNLTADFIVEHEIPE